MPSETLTKIIQFIGNTIGAGIDLVYISGTTQANSDTFTVTGLTTVKGAFLIATDGTVGTMTFSTNVITITNAGTKTWTGLTWGVP